MPVEPENFSFDSDAQSWAFTAGSGSSTGAWQGTGGNTGGCLYNRIDGRNAGPDTNYWEWTGTWEDLGVTAGNTVSEISMPYDWRCDVYSTGAASSIGPAEIRDSAGTTLIGTFDSGTGFSSTTSYATRNGSAVSIGATYQASNTTIRLRISATLDTANDKAAAVQVLLDNINVSVTHAASNQNITGDPAAATATAYDGTLTPGGVSITGDQAAATATAYDGTLSSNVNITGDPGTATAAAYDGTLTPGNADITGDPGTATAAAYDGTLTAGNVDITGDPAAATAAAYDGDISATVDITGGEATATAAAYDGTLTPGGVTITGDQATATAAAYDGDLAAEGGSQNITGDPAAATATAYDGTLTPGGVTVTGNQATATAAANDGTLTPGGVTITGDPASATAAAYDGEMAIEGAITGNPATATATAYDGTLTPGAITITGGPATATATAHDGSFSVTTYYPTLSAGPPPKKAHRVKKQRIRYPKYEDPNEFTPVQQARILETPKIVVEPQKVKLEPIKVSTPVAIRLTGRPARAAARCYSGVVLGGWTPEEKAAALVEEEILEDDDEVLSVLAALLKN